jgi:hypothetical protein
MNYLRIYCNLIRKAENRTPPEGYTEKHHIFPKSIFGNNNRIVVFTAREHYISHALLEKIYINRYGLKDQRTIKMTYAHSAMKGNGGYTNSTLYEGARKRRSDVMKGKPLYIPTEKHKEGMRQRRLGTKASDETKRKMSEAHKGRKNPHSEETKKNMRGKRPNIAGEKNPFYGKKHTPESIEKMSKKLLGRKSWRKGISVDSKYSYKLENPTGEIILTRNIKHICRENNLHPTCMYRLVTGKQRQHKGWKLIERIENRLLKSQQKDPNNAKEDKNTSLSFSSLSTELSIQ